jgi:hypothetical protein
MSEFGHLTISQRKQYFEQSVADDKWIWVNVPNAEPYHKFFAKLTWKQVRALEAFYEATVQLAEAGLPFGAMDFESVFQLDEDYKNRDLVIDTKEAHYRFRADSFTDSGGY